MKFTIGSKHSSFPVVDGSGRLSGIVTFQDVIYEESLKHLIVAKDLATLNVVTITPDESLDTALKKIGFRNIEQLPVVDASEPKKILGIFSRRDIFASYNKALIDRSLAAGFQRKRGE